MNRDLSEGLVGSDRTKAGQNVRESHYAVPSDLRSQRRAKDGRLSVVRLQCMLAAFSSRGPPLYARLRA